LVILFNHSEGWQSSLQCLVCYPSCLDCNFIIYTFVNMQTLTRHSWIHYTDCWIVK